MKSTISAIMLATTLTVAAATNAADAQGTTMPNAPTTGRVNTNGIDYYYEIHGSGEPLLLLHGGLGSMDMFRSSLLPALAKTRQVIAVDLQGHGRTTRRAIDLVDIGNDLAQRSRQAGFKQVDVAGYSFGGGAALRLAIQHPHGRSSSRGHLSAVRAERVLPGNAAAAGGCQLGNGRADEGDADVQVLCGSSS